MTQHDDPLDHQEQHGQRLTRNTGVDASPDEALTLKVAIKILRHDARPSLIVDLVETQSSPTDILSVTYHNAAFARDVSLNRAFLDRDESSTGHTKFLAFSHWIKQANHIGSEPSESTTYVFHNVIWSAVLLDRFVIISGLPQKHVPGPLPHHVDVQDNLSRVVDHEKLRRLPQSGSLSRVTTIDRSNGHAGTDLHSIQRQVGLMAQTPRPAHIEFFYSIDWASTVLGPIDTWSDELHQMCAFVMNDPRPALLFWGEEHVVIHNAAAPRFFPHLEKSFMGSTVERMFPQIWASIAPSFAVVRDKRQVVEMNNLAVLLYRGTYLKEYYVSYRYIPIENKAGDYLGIYQTISDDTEENLSQRRLATLLEVSSCSTQITEPEVFWQNLLGALTTNKEDFGFAIIYSLEDVPRVEGALLDRRRRRFCNLQGVLGISEDHASVKHIMDIDQDQISLDLGLKRALEDDAPVLLQVEDGTLPSEYLVDVQCRGFEAPCDAMVVMPIRPTGATDAVGLLIVGLSSRVVYDSKFQQFIEILNRQIATSMASITLFNEEVKRERRRVQEATLVHARLQARLEQETQALTTSEAKFERLTDVAPIGISITNSQGDITYANKAWYKIMGHAGTEISAESWIACLHEEDVQLAVTMFKDMITTKSSKAFEIRLRRPWVKEIEGAEPVRAVTWILASACVIEDSGNGQGNQVLGILTDISAQKWAEEVHRRKMVEALELKAQQESFIDTISHEMRNPLSAILQSVDEVSDHLSLALASASADISSTQSSIEAVETIALCCQHQRRVIDDVLTLSKMNTNMLQINLDESDPLKVVSGVIRIFSGDAKKQGISLTTEVEDSMKEMDINHLLFDPGRLSQVLVNLLGNAIKFTRDCDVRKIKVTVGTFASRPPPDDHGVDYVEPDFRNSDGTKANDDDENRQIYLRIVVQDTGIGMSNEEKLKLFKRFAQASPRTHIRYGGSGLGLFISKRLTELQGGAIGLKMGSHIGTTFAFYVRALRPETADSGQNQTEGAQEGCSKLVKDAMNSRSPVFSTRIKPHMANTKHTILVVEDNLVNQKVVCQQLRKKGYTVYAACHGAEALEFLERTVFWKGREETGIALSVVLLDIEMPVMDGLTCIRKIRQLEVEGVLNTHIPVISVSANARYEQVQNARLAGMDDNISKPFRITDLIPVMESLLAQFNVVDKELPAV